MRQMQAAQGVGTPSQPAPGPPTPAQTAAAVFPVWPVSLSKNCSCPRSFRLAGLPSQHWSSDHKWMCSVKVTACLQATTQQCRTLKASEADMVLWLAGREAGALAHTAQHADTSRHIPRHRRQAGARALRGCSPRPSSAHDPLTNPLKPPMQSSADLTPAFKSESLVWNSLEGEVSARWVRRPCRGDEGAVGAGLADVSAAPDQAAGGRAARRARGGGRRRRGRRGSRRGRRRVAAAAGPPQARRAGRRRRRPAAPGTPCRCCRHGKSRFKHSERGTDVVLRPS